MSNNPPRFFMSPEEREFYNSLPVLKPPHEELSDLRQERDSLRAALRECVEALDDATCELMHVVNGAPSKHFAGPAAKKCHAALARARKLIGSGEGGERK